MRLTVIKTGFVQRVEHRKGTSSKTGKDYSFVQAELVTRDHGLAEVLPLSADEDQLALLRGLEGKEAEVRLEVSARVAGQGAVLELRVKAATPATVAPGNKTA